jgi:2-polyprenyl-3-methyl-5-hydroxy-6-metoxy-1,4-benzoquinol methylase
MHEDVYRDMFEVEDRHWWYSGKQRIVRNLLSRYLAPRTNGEKARVADLGCGCGIMLWHLSKDYEVRGVDGSPQAIEFCKQRGVTVAQGQLPGPIGLPEKEFDAVLLLDVIEHLEKDKESVAAAAELLKPGGIMIVTVPAYQWLWSKWDTHHHHYRRYNRSMLKSAMNHSSLNLEMISYYNTWLFPLAATTRIAGNILSKEGEVGPIKVPMAPVNAAFREIFASERALLGRVPLPFGLSLVAVARRA